MQEVKPTKERVFEELRKGCGCCWLGGQGCHCYSRQLKRCYEEAEKRLTRTERTPEEIERAKATNQKAMQELNELLSDFFD